MKKSIFLFLFTALLTVTSCSKDSDDTDAIVGTWANDSTVTIENQTTTSREEYVFKSDKSGVYTDSKNGVVEITMSFTWSKDGETYTAKSATGDSQTIVTIGELLGNKVLLNEAGVTIAIKE